MRAEQVQAFVEVTEHGSFAAAARQSGIKRGTLSAAVHALEDSLGVALFERSGNSLTLTAVGEKRTPRLLPAALKVPAESKSIATNICKGSKTSCALPAMMRFLSGSGTRSCTI